MDRDGEVEPRFKKPAPRLLLTEVFRAIRERRDGLRFIDSYQPVVQADGHPVVVIPGFLTDDDACISLRTFINKLGYTACPWGLGRNLGDLREVDALQERIEKLTREHQQTVSLVGWSLGGIYAREAARANQHVVRQVITLGSPFGDLLNSGYVAWVYDLIKTKQAKKANERRLQIVANPVPVLSTALYSRQDGVVSWEACQEPTEDQLHQNVEVQSSHLGMSYNTQTLRVLAERLPVQI